MLKSSSGYRADIDGLRAVAVILVLLFHGGFSLLPSGFIGVDIFFVISGYLTAAIITKSMREHKFNFCDFYIRRIWRLQPAMIALFVFAFVAAMLFYLPDDLVGFLKSQKYVSLLISNQYFERATTAYAAEGTSSLLLLHTWSLAIEWQWYLLMPVSLYILIRYCAPGHLKVVMILLTVALVITALVISRLEPSKSYYFLTTRLFELMIGACIVVCDGDKIKSGAKVSNLLDFAALAVLVYCVTRKDILAGFPDYHALLACIATAVLLTANSGVNSGVCRLLSTPPFRYIGAISYSLYLWHWPVLAIMAYFELGDGAIVTVVYFVVSFVMACISYHYIENRFRYVRVGLFKSVALMMLLPAILFSFLYKAGSAADGWPGRFGSEFSAIHEQLESAKIPNRRACIDGVSDDSDSRCLLGASKDQVEALLIGDSYSNQYWGFMDVLAKDANVSVMALSTSACLALPGIYLFDWWDSANTIYTKCHDRAVSYYKLIAKNNYKYVILGQIWESYSGASAVTALNDERSVELSRGRVEVALRNALDVIVESGAIPVFVESVLSMPKGINECLHRRFKFRGAAGSDEISKACSVVSWDSNHSGWFGQLFEALKRDYPTLVLIDPKTVQCDSSVCHTTFNGVPFYRDIGHVTDYGSYELGKLYLRSNENPL